MASQTISPIILCLILCLILPLSAALPCFPGTFAASATAPCRPCPKGSYQFIATLIPTRCTKCPPGTYLPFRRARGKDLCKLCPANTFSTARGAKSRAACEPCPAGKVSLPGSVKCRKRCNRCQALRSDGCENCQYGFGSFPACDNPASSNEICVDGKIVLCAPGTQPSFGRNPQCRKCSGGISPDGTLCRRCPRGLIPDIDRIRCVPCAKGQTVKGISCTDCPAGQNTNGSRPLCVADGTPCPSNFFQNRAGNCMTCNTGEKYNPDRKVCVKCKEDEASPGGVSTRCKKCPRNQIGGATCECKPGFNRDADNICTPCPAGTVGTSLGCRICGIGTFSKAGSTECKECPPGTAQPEKGKGECVECKGGLVASVLTGNEYPSLVHVSAPDREDFFDDLFSPDERTRSDCVGPRTNCPPRTRRINDGSGNFYCEPRSCPPDSIMKFVDPRGDFSGLVRACVSCDPGFVLKESNCVICERTQISAGGTASKCVDCPRGKAFYASGENGRVCECVPILEFTRGDDSAMFRDKNGVCRFCPQGTAHDILSEVFRCPRCPKGSVAQDIASTRCRLCGKGTVEEGRVKCRKCEKGFTSFGVGDTECVPIGGKSGSGSS